MKQKKKSNSIVLVMLILTGLLSGCKTNEVVPVDGSITYEAAISHVNSLDKGGRWLSLAIKEINELEGLPEDERIFINNHLFGLIEDEDLRFNEKYHEDFVAEMASKEITEDAISIVKRAHIRISSPVNLHDGYWVGKLKLEGTPFKLTIINDMHVDAATGRITVYAQSRVNNKIIAPAQLSPGEFLEQSNGERVASHPDAVYLNGSGQELMEDDGSGSWWVKHSWVLGGEGYWNAELKPQEHYEESYVEGNLLKDGLTMKIGDPAEEWGYNLRKPIQKGSKTSYVVNRYEFSNDGSLNEGFTIEWKHKNEKSAFDGLKRSGPDYRLWNLIKGENNVE